MYQNNEIDCYCQQLKQNIDAGIKISGLFRSNTLDTEHSNSMPKRNTAVRNSCEPSERRARVSP